MSEDRRRNDGAGRSGAYWAGTIAFGLVAVPVHLYSALRRDRTDLRMVAPDGTPLRRRYLCSLEEIPVAMDDIVRGYETDEGAYVVVEDEELAALAPRASREIDLRRFVPREQVDPARFERAYVLAPEEGAVKPYRLLAHALASTDRVGIATFVMRDEEHLVAILAENGLLLAETLRFAGELRTPREAGLAAPAAAPADRVAAITRELAALRAEEPERRDLVDREARRLRNLVEAKLEANDDVLPALPGPAATADEDDEDDGGDTAPADLMALLRRSLADGEGGGGRGGPLRGRRVYRPTRTRARARVRDGNDDGRGLADRTKQELYETAKAMDIRGRSSMSKQQLIDAIRR